MTNADPPLGRHFFPLDEVTRSDASSVSEFARGRDLGHGDLIEALQIARAFNADQSVLKGDYLKEQFEEFETVASWVPGYLGSFGTGYPFYANRADGTVVAVEEIDRFVGAVEDKARQASSRELGAWLCGVCQVEELLPDLKSKCRPCEATEVKPRDIFKALPDLDFWVVLDETSPAREARLQQYLSRAGFFQSDTDIYFAIKDAMDVSSAIVAGATPDAKLPIDLHVVTKAQLLSALADVRQVITDVYRPGDIDEDNEVPIFPRSLHVTWEDVDHAYDFMKDFLFSFTPRGINDAELTEAIEYTRDVIKECLCAQDVVELVSAYPKEMRQLQNVEVQNLLLERWGL